ncbi:histidine kinase [Fluviicola sp.]|uniref:sensor histidine kinase n=1 Tax=Fluviicola sp. TaxID=1917219 RepID=UPI0026187D95|nr:histidine kinase [Fluviicola sp.]
MDFRILTLLFICCFNHLKAQELYGKYLGTEQGLLSKECYDINFNKEGYLIVGTQYGPMKFDGEKFIPICQNLPIEQRIIYDFEKDPRGQVYMLNSKNEIFILERDKAIRIVSKKSKPIPIAIHFKKLHWYKNGLMIFSNTVYFRYRFKTRLVSPCSKPVKEEKNVFVFDSSQEFPFEKRLSEKAIILKHTVRFKSPRKALHAREHISESREGFVKIGTNYFALINSHLYRVCSTTVEILPYDEILFLEAFHDRLWLVTMKGLIELDNHGNWVSTHFPGCVVGGIAPLPGKGMAVSLNQYGVFICSDIHERCYGNLMPSYVANHQQTILVGNKLGQLFHFQNNELTKIHDAIQLKKEIPLNLRNIRKIEFINDKWYICSIKGIYTLSTDLKKRKKILINELYTFNDFFLSGEEIHSISWSRIKSFRRHDEKQTTVPFVRCKQQINDSLIMLGTEEGLFDFHVSSKKLVRSKFFRKPHYISHIQELSPNEFLITSRYKGIFHFKNGRLLKKYDSPCVSAKKALITKEQLFVAGNQGIYAKKLHAGKKSPWKKIFEKEIQNLFLINGKLFICTDDDLVIKELSSKYEIKKPAVILNEILIGEQKTNKIPAKIDYNIPISLDFDILHFDANKLGLYYRLNGEMKIHEQTEQTKINFESLPGGNYELEIFPVIDGRIQLTNSKNYRFTINQPFWESTLFYLLISIVILLLLLSVRLVRNLRRKKRMTERAELESKLNEYKLLAVKAQVNPHFLSNGFAAIQALILKGNNDFAAHYLAKFSFLMRKILYYSETQFITINQELQLADAYLELELLRSNNHFTVEKVIQLSETQLATFKIPSLLLQPILENAIWHGLKFQESNPELTISFLLNDQQKLVIQITDNGPGFNSRNKTEDHLSKGNKLITERIDTLNKQFQKKVAEMNILTSDSGTKVIFTFTAELYQNQ